MTPRSQPIVAELGLVFVGGSVGTAVRYALSTLFPAAGGLPITFAINVTGAFVLGWLTEWLRTRHPSQNKALTALLGTGLLGGYTTYGMFAVDTDGLLDTSHIGASVLYGISTVVIGVAAALAGIALGRRIHTTESRVSR